MTAEIIAAIASAIAIIVTLITALTTTRSSAFADLEKVVRQLEKSVEKNEVKIAHLEKELVIANQYIRVLVGQLIDNGIQPKEKRQ